MVKDVAATVPLPPVNRDSQPEIKVIENTRDYGCFIELFLQFSFTMQ